MVDERKSRSAVLKERLAVAEDAKGPTFDVPFRGKRIPLRKITISTDFPLYRIQSGRTHRAHSAYLDEHPELPPDFFDDPEDPKVQQAQHQILLRMIAEMGLDVDLQDKGQLAPLVLTSDGFVVDGNRRLAALRESREEYLTAVVLPEDAENREIYETEIELQMQRETKAPYNWIDQALHIEYGIERLGQKEELVADRMRMRVDEVKREIEKLKLVRAYLEFFGEPGRYHKVPTDKAGAMEQAFEDLAQRLTSSTMMRKSEPERRMIRNACFAAIRKEAGYKQIRSLIRHLSQRPGEVLDRLREKYPPVEPTLIPKSPAEKPAKAMPDTADPLRSLADVEPARMDAATEELLAIMNDQSNASKAGAILIDIVDDLEAEEKDAKRQQLPLQRLQHAVSDLERVDLDPETEGLDEIARALERIFAEVDRLMKTIDEIRTKKSSEN